MKQRPFLALTLFFILSFSAYGEIPSAEMNINSYYHHIEKKLITGPMELDKLGLFGTDFHAQEYLDELLANFWDGLENNNYYLVFFNAFNTPFNRISEIRSGRLNLKAFIRVSKTSQVCSTYQSLNHFIIKAGRGLSSALKGVCGQIATVHSLNRLGKTIKPFNGKFIKEKNLLDLTQNNSGMTTDELADAHKKHTGKKCQNYQHVCSLDKGKLHAPLKRKAKKGLKTFVANLYKQTNSKSPKYSCSLVMTSFDSKGKKQLSHVEHISKVALNPRTKKAMVLTKNGLVQGDMKKTVLANAGINTIFIDPENLKCNFKSSTHRGVNAIYQGTSINHVEAICCPL